MKLSFYIMSLLTIVSQLSLPQDNDDFVCGTNFSIDSLFPGTYTPEGLENEFGVVQGGKFKTANGILKTLIVFVRFAGDNDNSNPYWTNLSVLPDYLQNSVDEEIPANSIYQHLNISNCFDRASGGNGTGSLGVFQMLGNVFYVTLENDENYYRTHGQDSQVNMDVLTALDDPEGNFDLDFRYFDNWHFMVNSQNYNHSYVPFNPQTGTGGDGFIDQVFIFWRKSSFYYPGVGGYSTLYLSSNFISNDGVVIRSGDGSTQFNAKGYTPLGGGVWGIGGALHEYGHFLFGGLTNSAAHFDGRSYDSMANDNNGNIHPFAKMLRISDGNFNSYERYRLNWLQPTPVCSTMSHINLQDTYVNNKALMIPIRYDNNNKLKNII